MVNVVIEGEDFGVDISSITFPNISHRRQQRQERQLVSFLGGLPRRSGPLRPHQLRPARLQPLGPSGLYQRWRRICLGHSLFAGTATAAMATRSPLGPTGTSWTTLRPAVTANPERPRAKSRSSGPDRRPLLTMRELDVMPQPIASAAVASSYIWPRKKGHPGGRPFSIGLVRRLIIQRKYRIEYNQELQKVSNTDDTVVGKVTRTSVVTSSSSIEQAASIVFRGSCIVVQAHLDRCNRDIPRGHMSRRSA